MTQLEQAKQDLHQERKDLLYLIHSSADHIASLCRDYSQALPQIRERLEMYAEDIQAQVKLVDEAEIVVEFIKR